jgi:hypothetical protein
MPGQNQRLRAFGVALNEDLSRTKPLSAGRRGHHCRVQAASRNLCLQIVDAGFPTLHGLGLKDAGQERALGEMGRYFIDGPDLFGRRVMPSAARGLR